MADDAVAGPAFVVAAADALAWAGCTGFSPRPMSTAAAIATAPAPNAATAAHSAFRDCGGGSWARGGVVTMVVPPSSPTIAVRIASAKAAAFWKRADACFASAFLTTGSQAGGTERLRSDGAIGSWLTSFWMIDVLDPLNGSSPVRKR